MKSPPRQSWTGATSKRCARSTRRAPGPRIKTAARLQTDGGGAGAFSKEVATDWSPSAEKRLLAKLTKAPLMDAALDRRLEIADAHPTEAVRRRLWKLATTGERDMRYIYAALLLYRSGHAADWYGWNTRHRPHLLDTRALYV